MTVLFLTTEIVKFLSHILLIKLYLQNEKVQNVNGKFSLIVTIFYTIGLKEELFWLRMSLVRELEYCLLRARMASLMSWYCCSSCLRYSLSPSVESVPMAIFLSSLRSKVVEVISFLIAFC